MRRAAEACRRGEGPVLLELLTYRRTGHSRRDPAHYQPKEEQEHWFQRDPIVLFQRALLERQDIGEAELKAIDSRVAQTIEAGVEVARRAPEPSPDDLTTDVFATDLK